MAGAPFSLRGGAFCLRQSLTPGAGLLLVVLWVAGLLPLQGQEAPPNPAPAANPQAQTAPPGPPALDGGAAPVPAAQPAPAAADAGSTAAAADELPTPSSEVTMDFRGVPLDVVLDHLSAAAGFVVVKEADLPGTVDVRSHRPLGHDELVDLLNTILYEKGFAAIRNGRILKIVSRDQARAHDLPVRTGGDPAELDRGDHMVTQIMPIRHGNAPKLLENLKPLLPESATMTANESSNAILLTATASDVHRAAEIIQALDTSISNITEIKVFRLAYCDAEDLASMIEEVFKTPQSSSSSNNRNNRRGSPFGRFRPPGSEDDQSSSQSDSEAKLAMSQVSAHGDSTTNTLAVSAPTEMMPQIEQLVAEVDVATEDAADIAVIPLTYADAETIAETIQNVFSSSTSSSSRSSRWGGRFSGRFGMRGGPPGGPPGSNNSNSTGSERSTREAEVTAVADTRTNSVIVKASTSSLVLIRAMVTELDANPAKSSQVFVYPIRHADLETLQETLQSMFEDLDTSSSSRTVNSSRTSRTSTRGGTTNTRGGSR